jgi:hypothetical protein
MPRSWMILLLVLCSAAVLAQAATVEHTFNVLSLALALALVTVLFFSLLDPHPSYN